MSHAFCYVSLALPFNVISVLNVVQGNHPKFRLLRCGVKIFLSQAQLTQHFSSSLWMERAMGLILANEMGAEMLITYVGFFSLSHFFHRFFLATFQMVQL